MSSPKWPIAGKFLITVFTSCSFHVTHLHDVDLGNEKQHCATERVQKHENNGKKDEVDYVHRT
jgi:hypothetical protein